MSNICKQHLSLSCSLSSYTCMHTYTCTYTLKGVGWFLKKYFVITFFLLSYFFPNLLLSSLLRGELILITFNFLNNIFDFISAVYSVYLTLLFKKKFPVVNLEVSILLTVTIYHACYNEVMVLLTERCQEKRM